MTSATPRQKKRADAAHRVQRAWAARVAGATWVQVAELVGYSDDTAACRAVRAYFGTLPQHDHEEVRALWRQRMEVLWAQNLRDVREQRPGAVRAGVAVAQRAAALDGLDKPTQVEVYRPDAEEFLATVAQLRSIAISEHSAPEGDIFDA